MTYKEDSTKTLPKYISFKNLKIYCVSHVLGTDGPLDLLYNLHSIMKTLAKGHIQYIRRFSSEKSLRLGRFLPPSDFTDHYLSLTVSVTKLLWPSNYHPILQTYCIVERIFWFVFGEILTQHSNDYYNILKFQFQNFKILNEELSWSGYHNDLETHPRP